MNERIGELWEQSKVSGVHPEFGEYDKYNVDKFAKLIVQECANIVDSHKAMALPGEPGRNANGDDLKKHFGIAE